MDKNIKNTIQNKQTTTESGRSMVEMLGVLAIIGVLSIGGIAGYTYAMNKYHANEILSGISQRAVVASQQMILSGTPSLVEYAGQKIGDYGVSLSENDYGDNFFGIQVSGIEQAVCEHLQDQWLSNASDIYLGDSYLDEATCAEGNNNTITFVFNDALNGSDNASGGDDDDDSCALTASDCPNGVDAENCVCQSTESQSCTDHTTNQCGIGYYCQFSPGAGDCSYSDHGDGVCKAVGSSIPIKDGDYLKSTNSMDWWSAYSWCKGNKMELVTGSIAGVPLNSSYKDYSGDGSLYQHLGEVGPFWTGYPTSCNAWIVRVGSIGESVSEERMYNTSSALCQ